MSIYFTYILAAKFISQILGGNSALHEALNSWLLNVTPIASRWTRCYLTTDHGWWASTFHTKCDNREPTVTLVKVGDYTFGGFLDQPWGGMSPSSLLFLSTVGEWEGGWAARC